MDAADVADLFPVPVSVCVATPAMRHAPLFEAERDSIAKAVAGRRAEFAAGRAAARQALADLGCEPAAILRGPGREPVWPAGFVGSITHTRAFCAAGVARSADVASLGLDAEDDAPLPPEVERLVCSARDYPDPSSRGDGATPWSKVIFSIKESFFKCQFPLTRSFLDFDAVRVEFAGRQDREGGAFTVLSRPACALPDRRHAFCGRWRWIEGLVISGVWAAGRTGRVARGLR